MAEQGVQEPALSRISPEDVFTERDRILGQIKNIYQNIEKTTHPMLIQQIEDEADFIVNMMVRLERLTGGKFRSDDTAVIQGKVSQTYTLADRMLRGLQRFVKRS